ncbi:LD-carboxypeptidase [bacterium]|nr:LD-carboxypeptidase [bacterium]
MKTVISIVAPSSVVPAAELALGASSLVAEGFDVRVDRQCRRKAFIFAGTHQERAEALLNRVYDSESDIIWSARGGYGSNHLLKILDLETRRRGKPRKSKLLVGSSDATSLLEFARTRWGFSALHAPMPGLRSFLLVSAAERQALLEWVRGQKPSRPWGAVRRLKWFGSKPGRPIRGEVVGGNLTVWNTMLGTSVQPQLKKGGPKILFLEDVTETLSRLDRSARHLIDARGLEGVSAIVLGNFLSCNDAVPSALARVPQRWTARELRNPPKAWLAPLRKHYSQLAGLHEIFGALSEETGIPVAYGLPTGHGPEHFALPLGAEARLATDGSFSIERWKWTERHSGL